MTDKPFWQGLFDVFQPMPLIDLADWSAKYRILGGSGSAERGLWRNERTPYLIEIMRELSPQSKTREVVTMKGRQLGFSECGLNWVLYLMHLRPSSILYLMPTESNAFGFSKQRLSGAIHDCEPLKNRFSKRGGNSYLEKTFEGGYLAIRGSNSPTQLRSNPFNYIVFDEIDGYPQNVGKEGNVKDIATQAQSTYSTPKSLCISTPTLKETSEIYRLYLDSDQRVYKVPCPHCSKFKGVQDEGFFEIKFENLKWTKGVYTDVMLICPFCEQGIHEYQKTEMLANGKWVAQNHGHWRVGFHLSSLYSPVGWKSWKDVAREFEEAVGNPEKMQSFTNTILGLPYEQSGEIIADQYLQRRAEIYNAEVPKGVLVLTMAVDVQKYYLEYEIRGWGRDEESWGIKTGRIEGLTSELASPDEEFPTVWKKLDEIRTQSFTREDGNEMRIAIVMIDSGGIDATTDTVYKYCQKNERYRVYALKGSNQQKDPIYSKPKRRPGGGCWLFRVGTFEAKRLIYTRLKIDEAGAGYYHFPSNEWAGYDALAYGSLTSERLITEYRNGFRKLKWWKPKEARNELLDLNVYNLVGIRHLNPNWDSLEKKYNGKREEIVVSQKPIIPKVRYEEGISVSF